VFIPMIAHIWIARLPFDFAQDKAHGRRTGRLTGALVNNRLIHIMNEELAEFQVSQCTAIHELPEHST